MNNKNINKLGNKQTLLNLFSVKTKPIELNYSGEKISSDGGLLLLKELENQLDIIKDFSKLDFGQKYNFF